MWREIGLGLQRIFVLLSAVPPPLSKFGMANIKDAEDYRVRGDGIGLFAFCIIRILGRKGTRFTRFRNYLDVIFGLFFVTLQVVSRLRR